jgi:hypothetical protein
MLPQGGGILIGNDHCGTLCNEEVGGGATDSVRAGAHEGEFVPELQIHGFSGRLGMERLRHILRKADWERKTSVPSRADRWLS